MHQAESTPSSAQAGGPSGLQLAAPSQGSSLSQTSPPAATPGCLRATRLRHRAICTRAVKHLNKRIKGTRVPRARGTDQQSRTLTERRKQAPGLTGRRPALNASPGQRARPRRRLRLPACSAPLRAEHAGSDTAPPGHTHCGALALRQGPPG